MSKISQRSHLTHSEAWRVVGRLERGQTKTEVAQAIGVSQSVISRIWNRFLETGSAGRRPGQGRRWATMSNEDRYLVLMARRHRNMNSTFLQQHLRSATGTTVSTQTVRNRLHGVGLYARRPMVCARLTSRHRREWTSEHVNCSRNEWSNVLFSDESRFSVHPNNSRIFIWMDRGNHSSNVSRPQTFPRPPSKQHMAITSTNLELAYIRKHSRSSLRPPMSSDLTLLTSLKAMNRTQGNARYMPRRCT
ncbi:transposable element Tcb2 transposase [Trichonephila clavipes]|nr:transposable element Tcb2 transposase [Trichonephila clavipes]